MKLNITDKTIYLCLLCLLIALKVTVAKAQTNGYYSYYNEGQPSLLEIDKLNWGTWGIIENPDQTQHNKVGVLARQAGPNAFVRFRSNGEFDFSEGTKISFRAYAETVGEAPENQTMAIILRDVNNNSGTQFLGSMPIPSFNEWHEYVYEVDPASIPEGTVYENLRIFPLYQTAGADGEGMSFYFEDIKGPKINVGKMLVKAATSADGQKVLVHVVSHSALATSDAQFEVKAGDVTQAISSTAIVDGKIEITLTERVTYGNNLTISMTSGAMADEAGNTLSDWTAQNVVNNFELIQIQSFDGNGGLTAEAINGLTLTTEDNPSREEVLMQTKVGKIVKGENPSSSLRYKLNGKIAYGKENVVTLKLFVPTQDNYPEENNIMVKMINTQDGTQSQPLKTQAITTFDAWTKYSFDYSADIDDTYSFDAIEIIFGTDNANTGTGTEYYIADLRIPSLSEDSDATLSDLKVGGTTVEGFSPSTTSYDVALAYGSSQIPAVEAVVAVEGAVANVGAPVEVDGFSKVTVTVTAKDASTALDYTINFTEGAPRTDATLKDLTIDDTTPENFNASTKTYTQEVAFGTTVFPVVAGVVNDESASVDVSEPVISAESAVVTLTVTAQDIQVQEVYTVTFTFGEPSTDVTLNKVMFDGETFEEFDVAKKSYDIELSFGTTDYPVITVEEKDENATTVVSEYVEQGVVATATVTVTAQDGQTQEVYTFNFTIAASLSDIATLEELMIDGIMVDGFAENVTEYNILLPYGTTAIPEVTAKASSSVANLVISDAVKVEEATTVKVTVTAQDGITKKVYQLNFTVALPKTDASITSITVGGKDLGYTSDQGNYTFGVAPDAVEVPATVVIKGDADATIVIDEASDLAGTTTITVTAQDGITKNVLTINYKVLSNDADLASISIDGAQLEGFQSATLEYTYTLPFGTTEIPVVSATESHTGVAKVVITQATEVGGSAIIVVTAEDPTVTLSYSVTFEEEAPSSQAQLLDLLIDGVSVVDFKSDSANYVISVNSTEVPVITAVAESEFATVEIKQAEEFGDMAFVKVTAQDGSTVLTYSVFFNSDVIASVENGLANLKIYKSAATELSIDSDVNLDGKSLYIYDLNGRVLKSMTLSNRTQKVTVLNKGLLIIQIIGTEGKASRKIIF
ncbi:T9SS type A sorting domain-containing protein [Flammeovirga aprica]|uniref:T9SS type A sorting domain-containing protein n=1 Tax=Flammeovirga aprica JL-4 TaxID=694437 RepID=A0A7X9RWT2_9BACT|nr:T9SS type A sorting domain-containing protein [Flammeovirga aprica]NME70148.1 T9SS type A sorting domain-containing protein [Flammeovirga aprica JL-4]